MRRGLVCADAGQAFPIYIAAVAGLLFLALAYFAVGQAAATRSEAQTAADAAALAAALETRDRLTDEWVANIRKPESWLDIFEGNVAVPSGCWRAHQLAARNDATVDCQPDGPLGYTVVAETNGTVGDTIVPGTENRKATESATAVIEARCSFDEPAKEPEGEVLLKLSCEDGENWDLKLDDLVNLPNPEDLFDVHLADSQTNDE
ncbi:pilus assembly protein TadG-related protein [Streptomyces sp. NPDC093586]|uniref:pilus assembly protein TadG-related protein n=1 Tax=Streptomyces sp. NPDC093586 TaxID=3366042 RepID=UPI0037FA3852